MSRKKKKNRHIGTIILIIFLILMMSLGSFLGYSIYKNGGGVQGFVATILGQDIEELENLDTINILVLRNK